MIKICNGKMPSLVKSIVEAPPRRIVLSGPSGFLGSRVLELILQAHELRSKEGVEPGEVILLSSSPGTLMGRLSKKYTEQMKTIRASRVDYFTQHDIIIWRDHLGSLGVDNSSVFINLAAVAGPVNEKKGALHSVNYLAATAAAAACKELNVSHFIQSSTQATNSERAGQVLYSRGKAMTDFYLSQIEDMPVTIANVGLLYCSQSRSVGQEHGSNLNLTDLALLPLSPIMGSGRAPLQPQEVHDCALRFMFLAMTDPGERPSQIANKRKRARIYRGTERPDLRIYDAVGPQTINMIDLLKRFAHFQGNHSFRPVHIDYMNMENILNIMHFGNLNRQFVALLRSEQDNLLKGLPYRGDPHTWDAIPGPDEAVRLKNLETAMVKEQKRWVPIAMFPFRKLLKLVAKNPKVIGPGIKLSAEIVFNAFQQGAFLRRRGLSVADQENLFWFKFGDDADLSRESLRRLRVEFEQFDTGKTGQLDEAEAMQLLKSRSDDTPCETPGDPPTFEQLRASLDLLDLDRNGKLSFLEWSCMVFNKEMSDWEVASAMGTWKKRKPRKDDKSVGEETG